jgi:hypothetical protein
VFSRCAQERDVSEAERRVRELLAEREVAATQRKAELDERRSLMARCSALEAQLARRQQQSSSSTTTASTTTRQLPPARSVHELASRASLVSQQAIVGELIALEVCV